MTFLDLVKQRESVRKYTDQPVEREKLEQCVEAARLAPSACNSQPWKFIIVDDPQKRQAVAAATYGPIAKFNQFTDNAMAMVAVVMEPGNITAKIGGQLTNMDYAYIDMGIAVEHFCLQATELGLGTCILGWSKQEEVKKALDIPKNKKVGLLISVGYPKYKQAREKQRKERVHLYNGYHE